MADKITHLTDDSFKKEVLESDTPVLVDFWAEWCGPCRMIAPIVEEIAGEHSGKMKFAKLNVDENQKTPTELNIMGIPTLIVFVSGKAEKRLVGAMSKNKLVSELEQWLK